LNKNINIILVLQFPEAVAARLEGNDSQSIPCFDSPGKPVMRDGCEAQEGEILHEMEVIQKQHEQDLENEKRREAEASSEFIRQLQVIWNFTVQHSDTEG